MKILFFRFPEAAAPRLQIFVSDLGETGAVRSAIAIANHAARGGYDVRLLTCVGTGALRGEVDPAVEIVELLGPAAAGSRRRGQLQMAFCAYRNHSREWRPDLLFSAGNQGHLLSCAAWLGLPGTKVLWIGDELERHGVNPPLHKRWQRAAKFRLLAALSDRLVLVSRIHPDHPLLANLLRQGNSVKRHEPEEPSCPI